MTNIDVRLIRQRLKISQEELGKIIGVSRNTIANYEKGGVIPESKHDLLLKLMNGESISGNEFNSDYKELYFRALEEIKTRKNIEKELLRTIQSSDALHKDLDDMGLSSIPEKERKKYETKIDELNQEIGRLKLLLEQNGIDYSKKAV